MKRAFATVMVLAFLAACASGLGGRGDPVNRTVLTMQVPQGVTAQQLGARIREGGFQHAIVAVPHDSAWLAEAASVAGLETTRPGRAGDTYFAFFGPKPVGDTLHTVTVPGGGRIVLHDALYRIDRNRALDLILARFDSVADLRSGVRALLAYVGSDVSNNAALLLAVESPTKQFGDSVALLVRALYADTNDCAAENVATTAAIRVFYGPTYRVRCTSAQVLNEAGGPIRAQFELR